MRRSLDPLEDLVGLDRKLKDLDKRLKTAVAATATTLTDIKGVETATAAMILGEVERHRLSRAGNRQLNHALHIVALSNKRNDDRGGAYYATKLAAGKGTKGALPCLTRRLSDTVFRRLVEDQQQRAQRSPGGTWGRLFNPARPAHTPDTDTSEQPHTGLHHDPTLGLPAAS